MPPAGSTVISARRLIIAGLLTALLIGYIGPVRGYFDQRGELRDEQAKLAQLEQRRDEYKAQLEALDTPEVLETRARELGLIKPGERAFLVRGDLAPPPPKPKDGGGDGGPFGWLGDLF
jgi:cell division protein FtsB